MTPTLQLATSHDQSQGGRTPRIGRTRRGDEEAMQKLGQRVINHRASIYVNSALYRRFGAHGLLNCPRRHCSSSCSSSTDEPAWPQFSHSARYFPSVFLVSRRRAAEDLSTSLSVFLLSAHIIHTSSRSSARPHPPAASFSSSNRLAMLLFLSNIFLVVPSPGFSGTCGVYWPGQEYSLFPFFFFFNAYAYAFK